MQQDATVEERKQNADIVISFGGAPAEFELGSSLYVEGLVLVRPGGKYALFFPVGEAEAAQWHCVVLEDIPLSQAMNLPRKTPKDNEGRGYFATGLISNANVLWGEGNGRHSSRYCSLAVTVDHLERLSSLDSFKTEFNPETEERN